MSWTDDISADDEFLPAFGIGGLILFIVIAAFAYTSHDSAMSKGVTGKVAAIGTCNDEGCAVKVTLDTGETLDRTTGSRVFIGEVVHCNDSRCYKN